MVDIPKKESSNQESQVEDIFDFDKTEQLPEQQPQPETRPEQSVETEPQPEHEPQPEKASEDEQSRRQPAPPPPTDLPPVATPVKDSAVAEVEAILSEHMDEIFLQMTPQEQMAFQQQGEDTATKINVLLNETKVKVKEVLNLIKRWLQLIPGVSKFFLEQEAKIKTDRLLNAREQKNKQ